MPSIMTRMQVSPHRAALSPHATSRRSGMQLSDDELHALYARADELPLCRPKRNVACDFSSSDGGRSGGSGPECASRPAPGPGNLPVGFWSLGHWGQCRAA